MKLLVTGGRYYGNADLFFRTVWSFHRLWPVTVGIHGAATGADAMLANWCNLTGIPDDPWKADWDNLGDGAGMARNLQMYRATEPDLVLAFPGNRGTRNMANLAHKGGTQVYIVEDPRYPTWTEDFVLKT